MQQPPGFVHHQYPRHVCKLQKAIYGLRQAPRAWYTELGSFLISIGFINSKSDTSLFLRQQHENTIYLLLYVDYIIVTGNDPLEIQIFLKQLADRLSLKDLGSLSYFLGMEVTFTSSGLLLSQRKYIQDLLLKTNIHDAKEVATLLSTSESLKLCDGSPTTDSTQY